MNNKKYLVTIALIVVVLSVAQVATTVQAKSGGLDDGRRQAHSDYTSGNSYDSTCSLELSHLYCFKYKLGYAEEWGLLKLVH